MKEIFIACPISKYIEGNEFTNNEFKQNIEKIYKICEKYTANIFLALRREEYGKKLMKDTCTELDFEEMKTSDIVVAIPEDSIGTAVELGWASCMNKKVILILDKFQRYTPLISRLNDITDTEIIWYERKIDERIVYTIDEKIRERI